MRRTEIPETLEHHQDVLVALDRHDLDALAQDRRQFGMRMLYTVFSHERQEDIGPFG
jgi:hypothetical protein